MREKEREAGREGDRERERERERDIVRFPSCPEESSSCLNNWWVGMRLGPVARTRVGPGFIA